MANSIDIPSVEAIKQVWKENNCLKNSSIKIYLYWIHRYRNFCKKKNLNPIEQLTIGGVEKFSYWYAKSRGIATQPALDSVKHALGAWAYALNTLNVSSSLTLKKSHISPTLPPILKGFAVYLQKYRGSPEKTVHKKTLQMDSFLKYIQSKGITIKHLQLPDIDKYIIHKSKHYSVSTMANTCSTLRRFCHYLSYSGQISADFSRSIQSPKWVSNKQPHKTLPWKTVRHILQAVDRQTVCGRRDYALLLMMSIYGLGAGEIINLTLDDINWKAGSINVMRPKTKIEFQLPLLPAVARALISYLRHGRPKYPLTRHVFVTMTIPYKQLASSVSIRHILHKHARIAGVDTEHLGTHRLRHTQATKQMELGVSPKIIGDILGHKDPASTSAYIRVSIERLRNLSLPVPI